MLRDTILTSETGQRMLTRVTPIYDESYVGLWMFQAIGAEYDGLWEVVNSLPDQCFPETATWSIELWEQRYGLRVPSASTLEARRANVLNMRRPNLPMNPTHMEQIATNATGCESHVTENVAPYTFNLQLVDFNPKNYKSLRKTINSVKPSHLSYNIEMVSSLMSVTGFPMTRAYCAKTSAVAPMALRQGESRESKTGITSAPDTTAFAATTRAVAPMALRQGDVRQGETSILTTSASIAFSAKTKAIAPLSLRQGDDRESEATLLIRRGTKILGGTMYTSMAVEEGRKE